MTREITFFLLISLW